MITFSYKSIVSYVKRNGSKYGFRNGAEAGGSGVVDGVPHTVKRRSKEVIERLIYH